MTDLEEKIKRQYSQRDNLNPIYNTYYSMRSMHERAEKLRTILTSHNCRESTVLEVGAGHGGNIPMLLTSGFKKENIELNELLSERIQIIKENYREYKLYEGDFLKLNFTKQYDYIYQSTVFTSILDQNERQQFASKMWDILKPGGFIIWYDFIYNNPKNNQVRKVTSRQLKQLFPKASSFKISRITLAPPIGRRVGKFYSLFNLPFLRTHILALIQKPL